MRVLFSAAATLLIVPILFALPDREQEPGGEFIQAPSGEAVFERYCARCHGPTGAADGALSPYLKPPVTDLSWARFKMVSGTNRAPTHADLERTIRDGLPGTPMPPFRHLPESWRRAVADYVLVLASDGFARRVVAQEGEDVDPALLEDLVADRLFPRAAIIAPPRDYAEGRQDRARELYARQCQACHLSDGRGNEALEQFDELGRPNLPRDFVGGIFKGGSDFEALYKRILLGIPGTAMPAAPPDRADVAILARHVQQLAGADVLPPSPKALHASVVETLPEGLEDPIWNSAKVQKLPLIPIDWTREPAQVLELRMLCDAESLAIRVDWSSLVEGPVTPELLVSFSDADYPAYLQAIEGTHLDLCTSRVPVGLPDDLLAQVRLTETSTQFDGERATAVLLRPLADLQGAEVNLLDRFGTLWVQLHLVMNSRDGIGDTMTAWYPLRFADGASR